MKSKYLKIFSKIIKSLILHFKFRTITRKTIRLFFICSLPYSSQFCRTWNHNLLLGLRPHIYSSFSPCAGLQVVTHSLHAVPERPVLPTGIEPTPFQKSAFKVGGIQVHATTPGPLSNESCLIIPYLMIKIRRAFEGQEKLVNRQQGQTGAMPISAYEQLLLFYLVSLTYFMPVFL